MKVLPDRRFIGIYASNCIQVIYEYCGCIVLPYTNVIIVLVDDVKYLY